MVDKTYISAAILKEPRVIGEQLQKGALILSQVDYVVAKYPAIRQLYYLIERRGWRGINESKCADIKLVEDLSTWQETLKQFPKSLLIDIGPADFVDIESFYPLAESAKLYDGIQISSWDEFKRPNLFIKAAALLQNRKFLKMGHFVRNGNDSEKSLRKQCIELTKCLNANIEYAYEISDSNIGKPTDKRIVNKIINTARLGILTTAVEGINRFKMECLSANIPVLVPNDTSYPTKKHINEQTGILYEPTPEGLAEAIEYALNKYESYSPRSYIVSNTGIKIAIKKLVCALDTLCKRDGVQSTYDGIYWDGRNESLVWGDNAEKILVNATTQKKARYTI